VERSISSSLCRFKITDEERITDRLVKNEIKESFNNNRCFEFYPDLDIIDKLRKGDLLEFHRDELIDKRNSIFLNIADGDQNLYNRLVSDTRLSSRLIAAMSFTLKAMAEEDIPNIAGRRIAIIKERPGIPTLYHLSDDSTVIAHVGQGPEWTEIPTIYLGLKTFDALTAEQRKGKDDLYKAFKLLLMVEERAIETGFSHAASYPPEVSKSLMFLVDEVIKNATQHKIDKEEVPDKIEVKPLTAANMNTLYRDLDARYTSDELNFDYDKNLKGITALERYARRYKRYNDHESLKKIASIAVAAAGHDIHEIRNRSNLLLERILAPKEFDAPLATRFITLHSKSTYNFKFELPNDKSKYMIRLYSNSAPREFFLEDDIDCLELPLIFDESQQLFTTQHTFDSYGHYDFAVVRKKTKSFEWLDLPECNGRVNIIPDVKGFIILEIFVDIHGHTRAYWRDESGHPGLLYNENGQVIRLGCFEDITVHLEDIKSRYSINAIYLLGVQERGSNSEDWAPEASSPSPFSPVSLIDIEPRLGGDQKFRELVDSAHDLDIKIILDVIPHVNRKSDRVPDEIVVKTYDGSGNLVPRSSTDGRYGSWNDGKLLNYRKLETWQWLTESINTLIDRFDIDGIRFDSAHAVPIVMKKNNYTHVYDKKRTNKDMLEGNIIVNEMESDHLITTGYYDSACRDSIAVPTHYYLMLNIEKKLKEKKKDFFINIAECFWGHERFLTRTGLIPYNASLFKICENIIHGKTDVREIYHIYDNYFPSVMSEGTELLGILGNHDERRALNTFGHRGLRAAVALTTFMSNIIMDYEGSAEGEGWKVYLDNIYVNWNQFEYAAHRSLEGFYREWYKFHNRTKGKGHLVWANNNQVAASLKFTEDDIWLGIFNFADSNQGASIQFDNPNLPIEDDSYYKLTDVLYSKVTNRYGYYKGSELKISRLNTTVSFTERVKLFKFNEINLDENYDNFIRDSFHRLCEIEDPTHIFSNFVFSELIKKAKSYEDLKSFIVDTLVPIFWDKEADKLELGLKRAAYFLFKNKVIDGKTIQTITKKMSGESTSILKKIGLDLMKLHDRGALVFMSAEADPFSKSGGLANVVYELPREMAKLGEEVHVITGYYRNGTDKAVSKMQEAVEKYKIKYTNKNIRFMIMDSSYEVGVHYGMVDGIHYYLLDHYEFFDGLYWGVTSEEKLRRRIAFSRACAEVILNFEINARYTFTNDAYAGLFNGIVRSDPYYSHNEVFKRNTFLHIIHNGGWQYFDSYARYEKGFDLFNLFNLPMWRTNDFGSPDAADKINCMATGIRFADRAITVSPSYARQIEYAADGMEHMLNNVIGISNAIGKDFREKIEFRFEKSKFIDYNYERLIERIKGSTKLEEKITTRYPEILKGNKEIDAIENPIRKYAVERMMNKLMIQRDRNLEIDPDKILFCMIHRISEQKGFQLLLESSKGLFENLNFQAILGGATSSGDKQGEEIAHGMYLLSQYYPESVNTNIGFQDVAVPLLCCDLFGMPSMHEPGGISQLEAFGAGSLVVARATGGLRDTVFPVQAQGNSVSGNGFLFSDFNPWSFYDAMERAHNFFTSSDEETITKARINAENSVYFWDRPAREYIRSIYDLTETVRILKDD